MIFFKKSRQIVLRNNAHRSLTYAAINISPRWGFLIDISRDWFYF